MHARDRFSSLHSSDYLIHPTFQIHFVARYTIFRALRFPSFHYFYCLVGIHSILVPRSFSMSVALVRLLCGFVVLLLALSLPLAEFQSTCPPASSGIQFDFSSLGNQQAGIVDKQGNGRGV